MPGACSQGGHCKQAVTLGGCDVVWSAPFWSHRYSTRSDRCARCSPCAAGGARCVCRFVGNRSRSFVHCLVGCTILHAIVMAGILPRIVHRFSAGLSSVSFGATVAARPLIPMQPWPHVPAGKGTGRSRYRTRGGSGGLPSVLSPYQSLPDLAERKIWFTLTDFDNVAIGISDVAPSLAVFVLRLSDKLGSSASP